MENITFVLLIAQFVAIIGLIMNTFKEQFLSFKLGIRRKTAFFIDIRKEIRITLDENLKGFEYNGLPYVWNPEKEKNGGCIFVTSNSEPLELTWDTAKCTYWCNSNEYHTNLKNKLLETMMMLKSKDQIILMLIIAIVLIGIVGAFVFIRTGNILDAISSLETTIKPAVETGITVTKG